MFTHYEQVLELTGYEVDNDRIARAQAIIEAYVGRIEVEVTDATDLILLARATAYQAAYMTGDEENIFEQVAVTQIGQFGSIMNLRNDGVTPYVAPLAIISCQRLSWKRIRSIKTGSIFSNVGEN